MKAKTYSLLLIMSFALFFSIPKANGQAKLIQFFDFNNGYPIHGPVATDSVGTLYSYQHSLGNDTSVMNTSFVKADYVKPGLMDTAWILFSRPSTNGILEFDGGTSYSPGTWGSFIYEYSNNKYSYFSHSDTTNSAYGNGYLKAWNPSQGSYINIHIPTTGYSNIYVEWCVTVSSSASAQYNLISYTTDSGATWKNLTRVMDTFNIGGKFMPDTLMVVNPVTVSGGAGVLWYPAQIDFSSDPAVNNNPTKFILRFGFGGNNAGHNDRYDNIAVWSGIPNGIDEASSLQIAGYKVYPNPAAGNVNILSTRYSGDKIITIYNGLGQIVSVTENHTMQTTINTSSLKAGVYFVEIKEISTGNKYVTKLITE